MLDHQVIKCEDDRSNKKLKKTGGDRDYFECLDTMPVDSAEQATTSMDPADPTFINGRLNELTAPTAAEHGVDHHPGGAAITQKKP